MQARESPGRAAAARRDVARTIVRRGRVRDPQTRNARRPEEEVDRTRLPGVSSIAEPIESVPGGRRAPRTDAGTIAGARGRRNARSGEEALYGAGRRGDRR